MSTHTLLPVTDTGSHSQLETQVDVLDNHFRDNLGAALGQQHNDAYYHDMAKLAKLEEVNMKESPEFCLYLSIIDVLRMTSSSNMLFIRGNEDNYVELKDAIPSTNILIDGTAYHQFIMGQAKVFVETTVEVMPV